ncbi:neural cell adhesion molecule 2-like [Saccoglossus kowalevskii]
MFAHSSDYDSIKHFDWTGDTSRSDHYDLIIPNVSVDDEGIYNCGSTTDTPGTIGSNYGRLTVTVPVVTASIVGYLNGSTANIVHASEISFTCQVIGTKPSADIEWLIGTDSYNIAPTIVNRGKLYDTTSVFTFTPDIDNYDDKLLQCKANNTQEVSAISTQVVLYVHVPLFFNPIISDASSEYFTGSTAIVSSVKSSTFTCTAGESRPEPIITWYLGSIGLDTNFPNVTSNGKLKTTRTTVTFAPQPNNHMEQLQCRAVNDVTGQYKHSHIVLNVYVPAAIITFPQDQSITEHTSTVTFQCMATGNPSVITYTWKKCCNDIVIDNNKYRLTGGSLTINNIVKSDAGTYTCYADNDVGQADSASATLNVYYLPSIIGNTKYYSRVGESVSMIATVGANPLPVTFGDWTNGDIVLHDTVVTSFTSVAVIYVVEENNFGTYSIRTTNDIGTVYLQIELLLPDAPAPPSISIIGRYYDSLTVQLVPLAYHDGKPDSIHYYIEYRSQMDTSFLPWPSDGIGTKNTTVSLTKLKSSTVYELRAKARDINGISQFSGIYVFDTYLEPSINVNRKTGVINWTRHEDTKYQCVQLEKQDTVGHWATVNNCFDRNVLEYSPDDPMARYRITYCTINQVCDRRIFEPMKNSHDNADSQSCHTGLVAGVLVFILLASLIANIGAVVFHIRTRKQHKQHKQQTPQDDPNYTTLSTVTKESRHVYEIPMSITDKTAECDSDYTSLSTRTSDLESTYEIPLPKSP